MHLFLNGKYKGLLVHFIPPGFQVAGCLNKVLCGFSVPESEKTPWLTGAECHQGADTSGDQQILGENWGGGGGN